MSNFIIKQENVMSMDNGARIENDPLYIFLKPRSKYLIMKIMPRGFGDERNLLIEDLKRFYFIGEKFNKRQYDYLQQLKNYALNVSYRLDKLYSLVISTSEGTTQGSNAYNPMIKLLSEKELNPSEAYYNVLKIEEDIRCQIKIRDKIKTRVESQVDNNIKEAGIKHKSKITKMKKELEKLNLEYRDKVKEIESKTAAFGASMETMIKICDNIDTIYNPVLKIIDDEVKDTKIKKLFGEYRNLVTMIKKTANTFRTNEFTPKMFENTEANKYTFPSQYKKELKSMNIKKLLVDVKKEISKKLGKFWINKEVVYNMFMLRTAVGKRVKKLIDGIS